MSVTIRGTDTSAAAPSFTGTDGDTGMFFPAADTIAFSEGGAESMRLTSNAQLSVNTASWPTTSIGNSAGRHIFGGSNPPLLLMWNEAAPAANNSSQIYIGAKNATSATSWAGGALLGAIENSSDASGYLAFSTTTSVGGNIERMRLNSTGALVLAGGTTTANGIGITFPATQSASSNANTLDDYEEGTFTPTVQGVSSAGTATYSAQDGKYTKIGNLVYVNVYLTYTGGTGTGQLAVGGLPFTSASSPIAVPSIYLDGVTFTAGFYPQAILNTNGTRIDFYQTQGGASFSISYDAAATILLSLTYRV
jgi:hypothetical protein